MKTTIFFLFAMVAFAQPPGGMSFMRMSPILNGVDVNGDGTLSAAEIADAPAQLRKLDRNGDGKLVRDEAGMQMMGRGGRGRGGNEGGEEPPAAAPSADELTDMLMAFDRNGNGKLEKAEVPERMQGLFERGDTNHDNLLTREEIAKLAQANRQQAGEQGEGRGRGPAGFDLAFGALDTNQDGEISAAEVANAATAMKSLDRNGDGQITNDEVAPAFGGRGGQRQVTIP